MILMIDNFDSFTFNLVQYLGELGADLLIKRNDEVTVADIEALSPSCIMISPGPCSPDEAGVSLDAIEAFAEKVPIFGVCLGHQSIAQVFGGKVVRAERLMHGKTSPVFHNHQSIYTGVEEPFLATRYHSLIVERESLPDCLEVTAWTAEGEIMGLRHRQLPIEGVQFHPESIMTSAGKDLLLNFLKQHDLIQQGGKQVVY